ncbi:type II secretion system protein N [uncultured Tateyamaria sp.]|uniref:type II secretion system protein N n=1 Tax=uncultured Tateyamaria sp. TaxID=455651 RepID=UPI00262256E0|nr:type II secretion system protein N [uncultured Tateyamaria sp.]
MTEQTNRTTADLATQRGALPLRNLQLLGIAGPEENRRALLRTAGGQTRLVHVGDSLRQGTIVAIGEDRIILNGGMGQRTLTLPDAPKAAA